jgi:hypothetical protein
VRTRVAGIKLGSSVGLGSMLGLSEVDDACVGAVASSSLVSEGGGATSPFPESTACES